MLAEAASISSVNEEKLFRAASNRNNVSFSHGFLQSAAADVYSPSFKEVYVS